MFQSTRFSLGVIIVVVVLAVAIGGKDVYQPLPAEKVCGAVTGKALTEDGITLVDVDPEPPDPVELRHTIRMSRGSLLDLVERGKKYTFYFHPETHEFIGVEPGTSCR